MFSTEVMDSQALALALVQQALEVALGSRVRIKAFTIKPDRIIKDNEQGFEYRRVLIRDIRFYFRDSQFGLASFSIHLRKDRRVGEWVPNHGFPHGDKARLLVNNSSCCVLWHNYNPNMVSSVARIVLDSWRPWQCCETAVGHDANDRLVEPPQQPASPML